MEHTDVIVYQLADDGDIPNSRLPLLVYPSLLETNADAIEERFQSNGWQGCWRNGIFSYHHYHSTAHEVLGCYGGTATVLFGGESGVTLEVTAGDAVLIPAGVGHKNLRSDSAFRVVGAYPEGQDHDMCHGSQDERSRADANIQNVPLPTADPVLGAAGGITQHWNQNS